MIIFTFERLRGDGFRKNEQSLSRRSYDIFPVIKKSQSKFGKISNLDT